MQNYAFEKGLGQVQAKDLKEVKRKLMNALGLKSRQAFHSRLKGEIEPKVSEARAIEQIFAEYQIKNVWGN